MKTSRFFLIVVLASGLASLGSHRSDDTVHRAADTAAPSAQTAVRFKTESVCQVPVLSRAIAFKGGATTGEEVTVRLDTARHTYEIRIDASKTPGRQGMRRNGTLVLDRQDCSYRLSGEAAARLAVNKDGILFGGVRPGTAEQDSPALIVAFKNTSRDILDLSGHWWVFESRNPADFPAAGHAGAAYEARILPDGHFSNCELSDNGPDDQCNSFLGRIHFNGKVFVSEDENGNTATLVVGRVADKLVPILLQQDDKGSGMRFFAPRKPLPPPLPTGRKQLPTTQ
jgi:hypothetical protein